MGGNSIMADIKRAANAGIAAILLHTTLYDGTYNYCRTIHEVANKLSAVI